MKKVLMFLILSVLTACREDDQVPDFSPEIDYSYRSVEYWGNPKDNEIMAYKYFDKSGKLIEEVGKEYRTKFRYHENGDMKERLDCRMYNCDIGWREILVYDKNGNFIGSEHVPKKIKNVQPKKFEQTKFYDADNNLIKEISDAGINTSGIPWRHWKYYFYDNKRIVKEVEKNENAIVWNGTYSYDRRGNLIAIHRTNDETYEIESFEYDSQKRLIKESIKDGEILDDNVSFSVKNNSTVYKYDKPGRLVKEITYNHKGEKARQFSYTYEPKK